MHSNNSASALFDIRDHILFIQTYIAGMDYDAFSHDMRTFHAVTRCLEIISEASRRLPDDVKTRHPEIPWKQVAGAGNIYRHDYEDVAVKVIWDTVQRRMDLLSRVVESEINKLERSS